MDEKLKKAYLDSNGAYREGAAVSDAQSRMNTLLAQQPQYKDSYGSQIQGIYNQIKSGSQFQYDPRSDAAFRQYADEYNALSGLAVAGNQAHAQQLTGGYGSTYAPYVASQGLARLREGVNNAQPTFYEMAQQGYMAEGDRLNNMYNVAATARDAELAQYNKAADVWNDRVQAAQQRYKDERNFGYQQYSDNRDYQTDLYKATLDQDNDDREFVLKSYDVYNKLAATKCADYAAAKNNSGMKAYLDGLVKAGKITQYMADNLYKQYEYTASSGGSGRRSSGSRSSRTSGGSGGSGYDGNYSSGNGNGTVTNNTNAFDNFVAAHPKELQGVDSYHYNIALCRDIKNAHSKGLLSDAEAADLLAYYGLTGNEYKSGSGNSGASVKTNKTLQVK